MNRTWASSNSGSSVTSEDIPLGRNSVSQLRCSASTLIPPPDGVRCACQSGFSATLQKIQCRACSDKSSTRQRLATLFLTFSRGTRARECSLQKIRHFCGIHECRRLGYIRSEVGGNVAI